MSAAINAQCKSVINKPPRRKPKKLRHPSEALTNPARETFAFLVGTGMKVADAYRSAGFTGGDRPRWELRNAPEVNARINYIANERVKAQAAAAARPEKKIADARLRLVRELERLAYRDLREVVSWDRRAQHSADGDIIGTADELTAVPSHKLSRDAAAGIKSVTTKSGALKIEFHDKLNALAQLAKVLGLGNDPLPQAPSVTVNQINLETNALEAARRVAFLLASMSSANQRGMPAKPSEPVMIEGGAGKPEAHRLE